MKIVFHPEAYEEMLESARFYEERDEGLGLRFLEAVEDTTQRIRQFPYAGPIEGADIRKRLVAGFPFTVLYQLQKDRVYIAAGALRPVRIAFGHSAPDGMSIVPAHPVLALLAHRQIPKRPQPPGG